MAARFDDSKKYGLPGLFLCMVLAGQPCIAYAKQVKSALAEQSDKSQNDTGKADDIFLPTSAWLVGPASLSPEAGKQAPCVMANQYNNGFLFRLSGGGQKIYAMAVDFRQEAFTPGQSYPVNLSIGQSFDKTIQADAYDAATLLINLQDEKDLYGTVGKADMMKIGIGGKAFEFALLGMKDGLKRLETCFNPEGQRRETGANNERVAPVASDNSPSVDPSYAQALTASLSGENPGDLEGRPVGMHTLSVHPAEKQEAQENAAPAGKAGDKAAVSDPGANTSPAAKQADDAGVDNAASVDSSGPAGLIDRMLQKAAQGVQGAAPSSGEAGGLQTAFQPQPPKMVRVDIPQNTTQAATPAQASAPSAAPSAAPEGQALAQAWTETAINPSHDRDIIENMPRSIPVGPLSTASSDAQPSEHRYRAMNGSNLRDILTIWSENNNVKLVWTAGKDYSVRESMSKQGDFQSAVQDVLDQYKDSPDRPVGRLYKDPSTGRQVLTIDEDSISR